VIFDWDYRNKELIHLLWVALAITGGLAFLELRSRDALASFLSPVMQRRLTAQSSVQRTLVRLVLIFGCLAFGVAALMRPLATNETESTPAGDRSADIMFVLDVSRSMLAEDATPNRLVRAKSEISQLVAGLQGHRVGLVVFAGRAAPVCPLTPDHSFFNTVLASIDTRSAGRGGTKVGDALKVALRGFPPEKGAKMIVLITDGDDQDPYTEDAAKLAAAANVKIVAVGLGSETGSQGAVDARRQARDLEARWRQAPEGRARDRRRVHPRGHERDRSRRDPQEPRRAARGRGRRECHASGQTRALSVDGARGVAVPARLAVGRLRCR
jgi:Mg-chelatase subunit ChlD